MKLGNSTVETLDTSTPQVSVLSGGRVVGSGSGIPDQGGADHFLQRFAVRSHGAYHQTSAMKFAMEHQNPLITGAVSGANARLPENEFSALSVGNPNVLLWALKPAEEGINDGIIVRLWNVYDQPQAAVVDVSALGIQSASVTSHIETNEGSHPVISGSLSVDFASQQLLTFRLNAGEPDPAVPAVSGITLIILALGVPAAGIYTARRRLFG
jgi:alpha-mannosidase